MNRTVISLAAALALAALSGSAAAAGDPAAGKAKIGTCMACHGNNGKGIAPEYPNLCGQNEKYLVSALKAYKDGSRNNAIMKPMAAMLADADVENVAAYYAAQKCN
jgi:cytochrome c553